MLHNMSVLNYYEQKTCFFVRSAYNKLTLNDKRIQSLKIKCISTKTNSVCFKTKFQGKRQKSPVGWSARNYTQGGGCLLADNLILCGLVLTTLSFFPPQQGFTSSSIKNIRRLLGIVKSIRKHILQVLYIYNEINAEFKALFIKKNIVKENLHNNSYI